MRDVPAPRSIRFTNQDIELLRRLQARLQRSQRDVLSMALVHLWETLSRDERVHLELREPLEEQ